MLVKLEISKNKIEKNIKKIQKINKNIICVLKDDAYGLGIENILPILLENKIYNFAVAYIEEALLIKKISKKYDKINNISIMTLNYIETEDLEKAIENDIEITLFSHFQLDKYLEKVKEINSRKKVKIHLKINTGMNRLGFDENEIFELVKKLEILDKSNIKCEIVSIYSHISNYENIEKTEIQIKKYENVLKKFNELGVKYKFKHIQASPTLFKYGLKYNYDFARIGMAVYGMEPLSEKIGLHQTVKLVSKIINIRKVQIGEQISYGNDLVLEEEKIVAVIPIGYAHGLKKQIENKEAYVLIHGEKAFILGEVCMDMIIVDVTRIADVCVEDEVVIIGKQKNEEITLWQMSKWTDTIQDDILSSWNKSIKRIVK